MLDFILCVATNFFRIYLICKFTEVFLGKSPIRKSIKYLVCFSFGVINIALFWIFRIAWINIVCNLLGISAIVRVYTNKIKINCFLTGSIYLINLVCDVAGNLLFISYEDGQAYSQIYEVIVVFLIFVCELIAERIVTIHTDNIVVTQNLSLIFVPLCSILVISILIYTETCQGKGVAIVGIGLLILNYLMLHLYNLLLKSIPQKYETEMLRQKVKTYSNQMDVILQSEEKVKSLRHDMRHHMNELKVLANQYNATKIQEYIDQMESFMHNPNEIIASGNKDIDSVLNFMLRRAKEELKTVNVKVILPEKIEHSFEINVLLGNLLENAIEAAKQTDRKYMAVNIALKRGVLKIHIENSYLNSDLFPKKRNTNDNFYPTTKKAEEDHGFGLINVRKIVEMHDGIMEITTSDDIFSVKAILYLT